MAEEEYDITPEYDSSAFPTSNDKENGSSYLFNADAQAILEEAPTLDAGLSLLDSARKSKKWDNEEEANKVASDYAQELRYRFKDTSVYSNEEIGRIAPISLKEIDGEGEDDTEKNLDRVSKWEAQNIDYLDTKDQQGDYSLVKDKLKKSITDTASTLRRYARTEGRGLLENSLIDTGIRLLQGATASPAKMLGLDSYVKGLKERTDPSFDDDLASDITQGLGMLGGAVTSAVAGPAGVYGYLGAQGGGQVVERYQQGKEVTGDTTKALQGAAIETGSQVLQTVVGGKVFAGPAKKIAGKVFGRAVAEGSGSTAAKVLGRGAAEGAIEGVGSIISNQAQRVGTDNDNINLLDNFGRNAIVGAIFGAGAGGIDVALPGVKPDPTIVNNGVVPPVETSVIGGTVDGPRSEALYTVSGEPKAQANSFVTVDGNIYAPTPEGATARTKVETKQEFNPFDKTFYVDKETAGKLARLRDSVDASENPVRVLTDGNSLLIKGGYINPDLSVSDNPTGARMVEVPTQDSPAPGLHPVEVNRPKNIYGNETEYRSHIGREIAEVRVAPEVPDSVGAMSIYETKERKIGERARLNTDLDTKIREAFGDEELGLERYFPQNMVALKDKAGNIIGEKGLEQATRDILAFNENTIDVGEVIAQTDNLINHFNNAAKAARSAGDMDAYYKTASITMDLLSKRAVLGTTSGQNVKAFDTGVAPLVRTAGIRATIKDAVTKDVAAEEGISVDELKTVDKTIEAIDNRIKTVKEEALRGKEDISKADKEADKEADKTIEDIDNQIKTIKEEALRGKEDISKADKEADKTIEDIDNQIKTIKEEALRGKEDTSKADKEAGKAVDKAIEDIDNQIKTIKEEALRGKEDTSKADKEAGKTVRGLISPEDKLKVDYLTKEIARLKKRVDKLDSKSGKTVEGLVSPEDKLKIDDLTKEVARLKKRKDKSDAKSGKTVEDLISPEDKLKIDDLTKKRATLKKRKDKLDAKSGKTAEDLISPEDKLKIDGLTEKRATLKKRKDKLDAKSGKTAEDLISPEDKLKIDDLTEKRATLKKRKDKSDEKSGKTAEDLISPEDTLKIDDLTKERARLKKRKDKLDTKLKDRQKTFSPEAEEQLQKMLEVLPKLPEGTTSRAQTEKLIEKIENDALGDISSTTQTGKLYAYWMANILSNVATFISNFKGNLSAVTTVPLSYIVAGKIGEAGQFTKGAVGAIPDSVSLAYNTFRTGETKIREGKFDTRLDFVKEGPPIIRNLGYVLRALSATDEAFFHTVKEGQAKAVAYYEGKKEGLKGRALQEKIAESLYNGTSNWADSMREAESHAKLLKDSGVTLTPNQIRNTAWELMEAKRPAYVREETTRFGLETTFNNIPKGFIGHIVKAISDSSNAPWGIGGKEIRPLKYVLPFMNIGGNLANYYLGFTPVGGLRALNKTERIGGTIRNPTIATKHPLQRSQELGNFLIGTFSAGILYGIAREFMDYKDPYFTIYGPGPRDWSTKSQLLQTKWAPYSVKLGDNYYRYADTPLSLVLGGIGSLLDNHRYNKKFGKSSTSDQISIAVLGMSGSFVDNSFLKNVSTLIETISNREKGTNLTNMFANISKGFIPAVGAMKMLSNAIDDPITTKGDLWAKFVSGIPFAQSIGTKKALNAFGEPIGRTFAERIPGVSRFISKRVTDPDWRWLAENGYQLTDAGGVDMVISTKQNPSKTRERVKNLGPEFEGVMTPEERYELTKKSGPDIKKVVSKFRTRYETSGFREQVQENLNKEIAAVRSNWKKKMFLR